jgi:competence protein ComEA
MSPIPERDRRAVRPPDEDPDPAFWGPTPSGSPRTHRPSGRAAREPVPYPALDGGWSGFHRWRSDPRVAVAALVLVAVAAGVGWYVLGVTGRPAASSDGSASVISSVPSSTARASTTSSTGPATTVTVHVAGAVGKPGVVELTQGARVVDAVKAAGGGTADADLDRLNLAAVLTDGQRVFVPKGGQSDPLPGAGTGTGAGGSSGTPAGPVSLNTASQAELETLPGVGPVLAQAIIAERERRGGFRSVNELRNVRGIGDARFADLEGLVTV